MKYFIDTEFLEGAQKGWFGKITKPTIDLISVGIVCEDGREYYAISKDFNLRETWNRWQRRTSQGDRNNTEPKEYWIRENVLKPIWIELRAKEVEEYNDAKRRGFYLEFPMYNFNRKSLERLINKYGKSNNQIAEDVKKFIHIGSISDWYTINCKNPIPGVMYRSPDMKESFINFRPKFYGYY